MITLAPGDVITVKGPSVPGRLSDKFFRVEAVEVGKVTLSHPFNDLACTDPYHAVPPDRLEAEALERYDELFPGERSQR